MTDPDDATPASPSPQRARLRRVGVVLAGVLAGWVILRFSGMTFGDAVAIGLLAALPLAIIPPLRRGVMRLLEPLARPDRHLKIALAVGGAAALWVVLRAIRNDRVIMPLSHDENSYWLGANQLARGRLWYPAHPMADFFESFHILTEPVYGSVYWPGTALAHAPGIWLGLPPYAMALVIYAALIAAIYLLTARLTDGISALVAAIGAAITFDTHAAAMRIESRALTGLLGLSLVLAWLCWRRAGGKRGRWSLVMGICAGWLAITRPLDAVAFILPVAVAVLGALVLEWRRETKDEPNGGHLRPLLVTLALGLAGALPFLALQVAQNAGMTGNPLKPPYVAYFERYQPGLSYGEGIADLSHAPRPATALPQKIDYYDRWLARISIDEMQNSLWWRLSQRRVPGTMSRIVPAGGFHLLLAVGVLVAVGAYGTMPGGPGGARRPLLVLIAAGFAFLLLYQGVPTFQPHHAMTLAAVAMPLAGVGVHAVRHGLGERARPFLTVLLVAGAVFCLAITLWQPPPWRYVWPPNELSFKYRAVPQLVAPDPALILVRWDGGDPHVEPVYNSGVPWPDDARIIWAHDLDEGRRAGEILDYYARRQPRRQVYLMFRPHLRLHPMGSVREALQTFNQGNWPSQEPAAMPPVP